MVCFCVGNPTTNNKEPCSSRVVEVIIDELRRFRNGLFQWHIGIRDNLYQAGIAKELHLFATDQPLVDKWTMILGSSSYYSWCGPS